MPKDSTCPADNGGAERIRHRLLTPSLADLALLASFGSGSGSGEESKTGAGRQHHAWRDTGDATAAPSVCPAWSMH